MRTPLLFASALASAAISRSASAQRLHNDAAERVAGTRAEKVRRLRGRMPEDFYPEEARRERLDGYVAVDLLINEDGFVVEAGVLDESPPGKGFGLAALDVAKTYEFDNGLRKPVLMQIVIAFLP
jgi:TonB family protein